jgi:hypothetical protein
MPGRARFGPLTQQTGDDHGFGPTNWRIVIALLTGCAIAASGSFLHTILSPERLIVRVIKVVFWYSSRQGHQRLLGNSRE